MPSLFDILSFLAKNNQIFFNATRTQLDLTQEISGISRPDKAREGEMAWTSRDNFVKGKGFSFLFQGSLLLVPNDLLLEGEYDYQIAACRNPRLAFIQTVNFFFQRLLDTQWPDSSISTVHTDARIGNGVVLSTGAVIGSNVIIGDSASIGPNTVIANCVIGNRVNIGANCTIGLPGFGFEKDDSGRWWRFPHIGRIVIEDDVDIGSNTCIDRGGLGDTIIGCGSKIDNLVHIAHNVSIGSNCLVIANSMIGGSVQIGENVWIAPSVSIINKVSIETSSVLGMGAVVTRNVAENAVVVGNPAQQLHPKGKKII